MDTNQYNNLNRHKLKCFIKIYELSEQRYFINQLKLNKLT